jgi:hypothetical protein
MANPDPQLQAALDTQLAHCQRLLESVTDVLGHWRERGGRAFESTEEELIHTIFARSTRTYEAVVEHLGNRGMAEQGAMLNRSLFEDMVDARWVSLHSGLALQRLHEHERYSHALRLDVAKRFPGYLPQGTLKELDPPMSEQERKESKKHFGRFGDGPWTGEGSYGRFKAIETTWPEGLARRRSDFFRAWLHRLNNETLHLSAYSLARVGGPQLVGNELHFRLGSTEAYLTQTLWCAFWTYWQTASFVFEHFGLQQVAKELDKSVVALALAEFAEATRRSRRPRRLLASPGSGARDAVLRSGQMAAPMEKASAAARDPSRADRTEKRESPQGRTVVLGASREER